MDRETVMEAARTASERAYAPYSNFHVGAAILTAGGKIHSGLQHRERLVRPLHLRRAKRRDDHGLRRP